MPQWYEYSGSDVGYVPVLGSLEWGTLTLYILVAGRPIRPPEVRHASSSADLVRLIRQASQVSVLRAPIGAPRDAAAPRYIYMYLRRQVQTRDV